MRVECYCCVVSGKVRRHFVGSEGGEQIGFAILCHFANWLPFNKKQRQVLDMCNANLSPHPIFSG